MWLSFCHHQTCLFHSPCFLPSVCRQVKITATDVLGEGGAPLMTPDQVPVTLHAGPAAQLSVEGPATLEVGTKAVIPQLRVRVCDASGNPTSSETFEVGGRRLWNSGWLV